MCVILYHLAEHYKQAKKQKKKNKYEWNINQSPRILSISKRSSSSFNEPAFACPSSSTSSSRKSSVSVESGRDELVTTGFVTGCLGVGTCTQWSTSLDSFSLLMRTCLLLGGAGRFELGEGLVTSPIAELSLGLWHLANFSARISSRVLTLNSVDSGICGCSGGWFDCNRFLKSVLVLPVF